MIAIPALDIRAGNCVQLIGGSYDREVVRLPDPTAVARRWGELGFSRLHVVDLDAATRRGSNASVVRTILNGAGRQQIQVGGGVSSDDQIAELLGHGAANVLIGSRAIEEPTWLATVADRFPGRLIVAADVRGRRVLARGWAIELDLDIVDALRALEGLPLAGVLVTAVHREGLLHGPDIPLIQLVGKSVALDVYAAGGITTLADLSTLAACGVYGAIIGTALYTGALDPSALAREYTQ